MVISSSQISGLAPDTVQAGRIWLCVLLSINPGRDAWQSWRSSPGQALCAWGSHKYNFFDHILVDTWKIHFNGPRDKNSFHLWLHVWMSHLIPAFAITWRWSSAWWRLFHRGQNEILSLFQYNPYHLHHYIRRLPFLLFELINSRNFSCRVEGILTNEFHGHFKYLISHNSARVQWYWTRWKFWSLKDVVCHYHISEFYSQCMNVHFIVSQETKFTM
jgi:hypothetical protein